MIYLDSLEFSIIHQLKTLIFQPIIHLILISGVLWVAFFAWFRYLTRWRVDPIQLIDCKLGHFVYYFFRHYSSTLLVIMAIEKFFALYFPLKSKTICTVKTAKWATGCISLYFLQL